MFGRMREEDRKKGKGEPGERASVPGQMVLENMVPTSQSRKFMLRAIVGTR